MVGARIAVVILNWNQEADTSECLASLRQVREMPFDTYVVDNGSTDMSADKIAERFPEICLIRNPENLGYAGGNNVGIRRAVESGADYVLLLNNDTSVDPEFLSELVKAAERYPEAGILGAKVVYHDRPHILWALGGDLRQPLGRIKMFGRDEPADRIDSKVEEFDHVPGAAMFVRSQVFKQLGILDTEFFFSWEDVEFCIRAKRAGWKVMGVPGSVVFHKVSRASAGRIAIYFGRRNRLLFASKLLPRWQFALLVVPVHIARLAALVVTESFRGRLDVVRAATLGTLDFFRGRLGKGSISRVLRY